MAILHLCWVLVYKMFFSKNGVCAGRSTLRVLSWYDGGSEYLEGTADDLGWSCLIGHRFYLANEFPLS
jgi:hypothetical protein